MTPAPQDSNELATELRATLAARRELGPEMDDVLVDGFMERVNAYVDARVASVSRSGRTAPMDGRPRRTGIPGPLLFILLLFLVLPMLGMVHVHFFPILAFVLLILFVTRSRHWHRPHPRI